jgi:hypothetical protein
MKAVFDMVDLSNHRGHEMMAMVVGSLNIRADRRPERTGDGGRSDQTRSAHADL